MCGVSKEKLLYANHNFHVLAVLSAVMKGMYHSIFITSAAVFVSLPEGWQRPPFHLEVDEAIMVNSTTRLG